MLIDEDWESKWILIKGRLNDEEYDEHCFGERTNTPSRTSGASAKSEPLEDILWAMEPGSYMSKCPIHEDNEASLSVLITPDKRVLVNCFAGCDWRRIQDYVKDHV
jgi:hypothetical protein